VAEVGKEGGRLWKEMSEEDKAPYNEAYQAEMEVWKVAVAAYDEANPPE
jgi:hypothetical protein